MDNPVASPLATRITGEQSLVLDLEALEAAVGVGPVRGALDVEDDRLRLVDDALSGRAFGVMVPFTSETAAGAWRLTPGIEIVGHAGSLLRLVN